MNFAEPNHKLLSSQKTMEDYFIPCVRFNINRSVFVHGGKSDLQTLANAAEGIIDVNSYNFVLNPTNTKNKDLTRVPAKLRNYPLIQPLLEYFLGDNNRRPNDPTVIVINPDSTNKYLEAKSNAMRGLMAQDFINHVNKTAFDTGVPTQEVPSYQEAMQKFDESYKDTRAVTGQEALDYIRHDLNFDNKVQELMYDWLVFGTVITYKDVFKNDLDYTVCDPRFVDAFGVPENGLLEDSDAVVYLMRWNKSQIIQRWNKELADYKDPVTNKDGFEWLDSFHTNHVSDNYQNITTEYFDEDAEINNRSNKDALLNTYHYNVYVCAWKGLTKVGNLSYIDPVTGQAANIKVDDTYKFNPAYGDLDIEWEWIEEWYYGYSIEDKLYFECQAGLAQRQELNNNTVCKLPFNGTYRGHRASELNSIVKLCLPYQVLYNIMHFRFELALAKAKGMKFAFPIGLIPKKKDWNEEKWFYWMDVNDIIYYDESAPNALASLQGIKEINLSISQHIVSIYEFMKGIQQECWDAIGVNRQALGQMKERDGKANTFQALNQSSIITDEMFRQLHKFLEFEYQGMLDLSKIAWINGKKATYITSDKRQAFLNIEGVEYQETEFGIFIKDTAAEHAKIQKAQELLLTLGQNGMPSNTLLDILDANSMAKIRVLADKGVKLDQEFQQMLQQQNNDAQAQMQQALLAEKQKESDDKKYIAHLDSDTKKEVAYIQAGITLEQLYHDTLNQMGNTPNDESVDSSAHESRMADEKNRLEVQKSALAREQMNLKREQMATQERIAKENKNKYDKAGSSK